MDRSAYPRGGWNNVPENDGKVKFNSIEQC